jgi:hypothetical protein
MTETTAIEILFDQHSRLGEQRWRHSEAELVRGLEIDRELELGRDLDRQIARRRALQYLVDVRGAAASHVREDRPVTHQAARANIIGGFVNRRQPVFRGELTEPFPVRIE